MTFEEALNYFGSIGALIGGMGLIAWLMGSVSERIARNRCRYRHPASVGRRARIVEQRRAALNRRGW